MEPEPRASPVRLPPRAEAAAPGGGGAASVVVHVKLPSGNVITVAARQTERVGDLSARAVAAAVGGSSESTAAADLDLIGAARLIFAGRALDPGAALASYNIENESELMLQIRPAWPAAGADPWAAQRAAVARAQLEDFDGFEKVGGRDMSAVAGAGYTQHGVCSYVYKVRLRADAASAPPLALKVMHNMNPEMDQTIAITRSFSAEHELLSDIHRLPPHPHIMSVLRAFTGDASTIAGWAFEDLQPQTLMLVMPFVPKDLQNLLNATRRAAGQPTFGEARAVRLGGQIARALVHLEAHAVVHRDVKLDNVLVDAVGTEAESAVLTDFGMCFDFRKNRIADCRVPMFIDGFGRGGAIQALAPEVFLPQPGPGVFLDYSKNDAWALGRILHELLSSDGHTPFDQILDPATYTDVGYRPVDQELVPSLADAVNGLLSVDPCKRLTTAQAVTLLESADAEIAAAAEVARQLAEQARLAAEAAARAEAARLAAEAEREAVRREAERAQIEAAKAALQEARLREAEAAAAVHHSASAAAWPGLLQAAQGQAWKVEMERKNAEAACQMLGVDVAAINAPLLGSFDDTPAKRNAARKKCIRAGLVACLAFVVLAGLVGLLVKIGMGDGELFPLPEEQRDRRALLAFKASGNGEGLESWVEDGDPCGGSWVGVTCGGGGGGVTSLDLGNTAVTGDVGPLQSLTQLTYLWLSSTTVTGDIKDLAGLTQLTELYLGSTAVTGDIKDLAGLTQLTALSLASTAVTGDIKDLAGLTQLTRLNLDYTAV
eukprot:SAG22_NODE_2153_length_2923_cov_2.212819_1_plen_775_part_10